MWLVGPVWIGPAHLFSCTCARYPSPFISVLALLDFCQLPVQCQ
jgi:hypothetical protein